MNAFNRETAPPVTGVAAGAQDEALHVADNAEDLETEDEDEDEEHDGVGPV